VTPRVSRDLTYLILVLEASYVRQYAVRSARGAIDDLPTQLASWDPATFCDHPRGIRLIEEIVRRVRDLTPKIAPSPVAVAISLPGTVEGCSVVSGSSRLGIYDTVNFTDEIQRIGGPPTYVFHDVECMALGEARYGTHPDVQNNAFLLENLAYILIDEGVGSALRIGGRFHKGAGVAGHLGRLVVQPGGVYNKTFSSRGPLEVYAGRPWVSHNIVTEFLSEKDKRGARTDDASAFRAAVAAASERDWTALSFEQIAEGIKARDPLVVTVIEDAAQYMSIALNAMITIVNPPLIILGGGMIDSLPDFGETLLSHARRHAWAGTWNETIIHIATLGRRAQILGAAEMVEQVLKRT
jgi:glucokinase